MKNSIEKVTRLKSRFLCLALSLAVFLSLAACGGGGEKSDVPDGGNGAEVSGTVYVPDYRSLEDSPDWLNQMLIQGDVLYGTWRDIDPELHASVWMIARWDLETLEKEELPYRLADGSISQMAAAADGTLTLLVNGTGESRSGYYIVCLDENGEVRTELPVGQFMDSYEDGTAFPRALAVDKDGNIYLFLGFYEQVVLVLDSQGNKKFDLTDSDVIIDLVTGQDGTVYALTCEESSGGYVLNPILAEQGGFGESYTGIPGSSPDLYAEDETHFLVSAGDVLYRYDMATQSAEQLLNWINVDIDSSSLLGFASLKDGRICAAVYAIDMAASSVQSDMIFLTETEASQVRQKTIITYGVWGALSRQMKQQILRFNKTNEAYRIEVKDYFDGKSYVNLEQGIVTFHADLAAGTGPDLVDLNWLDFSNYADKGAFADLNAFLKKDSAISREDLIDRALHIYEVDGKLYGMPLFFSISTLVGRTENLQGLTGWTVEDIQRILAEQPEETAFLGGGSREGLLNLLVSYQLDQFVDWEEGTCRFESQEFIDLLTFAASCPFPEDLSEMGTGTYFRIHEGKVLVTQKEIFSVGGYQLLLALYDNDDVTFIGYPTADGTNGTVMNGIQPIAILASSDNQEGAWEFMKTLLSQDYQAGLSSYYFPVLQSALNACLEDALKGNFSSQGYVVDDFEYERIPATQEQIDGLMALIDLARPVSTSTDSIITSIISEEAAAFFAGQKTAEAVAEIIQSRLAIYVSENS